MPGPSSANYDVVILGGGLAGSCLARQLKRTQAGIRILVAERNVLPVPEAAHKVGESSVEMGAAYFRDVLGLKQHLERDQLFKSGLRFYYTESGNAAIEQRYEFGASFFPPVRTYQLDRGRLENMLAAENAASGVDFRDACKVESVKLDSSASGGAHTVRLQRNGETQEVTARWVVDASGRASILKRLLGLQKPNDHDVNAAWWRISEEVDIAEWSDDLAWRERSPEGFRRLATNHLMGRGYWVWLIPLASGSTSFGIVADPAIHAFDTFNTFERAVEWLRKYEPQCAQAVEARRAKLQDFRVLRHYSHSCKQVFSSDRWALTGEAGVFLDPFYSPGSDFIGLGNTIICDLIFRDLKGEPIAARAEAQNRLYLGWFETFLGLYRNQYPIMGNAQVMTVKIVWDYAAYWAAIALLFFRGKVCDLEFMASVARDLNLIKQLNDRMQWFLRDWSENELSNQGAGFVDCLKVKFLYGLHIALVEDLNDDQLRSRIAENRKMLEALAVSIFRKAAAQLFLPVGGISVDPYAISLRPEDWPTGLEPSGFAVPQEWPERFEGVWLDGPAGMAGRCAPAG